MMLNPVISEGSSQIRAFAYNLMTEELFIQFNSGDWYTYQDVDSDLAWEFAMAESRGKFLNAEIKKNYEVSKLTETEIAGTFY